MPKNIKALVVLIILGSLGISSAQAGLFSTRYGDFKELVEAGKVEEATVLYAKERVYFSELKNDKRKFVDDVLAQRDQRYGTLLADASVSLMLAEAETSQMLRWQKFKKGFEQAQIAIARVETLPASGPLMSSGLTSLKASVLRKTQTLQSAAPQALLEYGLFTEPPLPTQYPLPIKWTKSPEFVQRVEEQLSKASLQQLASFKKTYGDTLIPALDIAPKLTEFYVAGRIREAGARSYLAKRLIRERLTKDGWPQASNVDSKVLLAAWSAPKSEVSSYRVTAPTSVGYMMLGATNSPENVIKSFAVGKYELIIFVRPSPIRLERTESNVRQVNSRYQTGTRQVENPDYAVAEQKLSDAQDSLAQVRRAAANASSDTGSTLGLLSAVVGAATQAAAENSVSNARRRLEDTPSTIEEPVFAAYTYTARTIAVKQSVTSRYAVYDPATGQTTTGTLDRNFNKNFSVADSVRTDDPNRDAIIKSTKTSQDVEAWINSEAVDKSDAIWAAILADYKARNLGI